MVLYETKKWGGFAVLYQLFCLCDTRGSVLPQTLPYMFVAASIAGFIKLDDYLGWSVFSGIHDDTLFDSTYALQVWATSVGFLLVFRGNLAYQRFWEGRGAIAKFSSYLQDTALMCVTYDEANKEINQYREWKQVSPPSARNLPRLLPKQHASSSRLLLHVSEFVAVLTCASHVLFSRPAQEILHLFSLLHALGLQCLRLDDNLDNLQVFDPWEGYKQTFGALSIPPLSRSPAGSLSPSFPAAARSLSCCMADRHAWMVHYWI